MLRVACRFGLSRSPAAATLASSAAAATWKDIAGSDTTLIAAAKADRQAVSSVRAADAEATAADAVSAADAAQLALRLRGAAALADGKLDEATAACGDALRLHYNDFATHYIAASAFGAKLPAARALAAEQAFAGGAVAREAAQAAAGCQRRALGHWLECWRLLSEPAAAVEGADGLTDALADVQLAIDGLSRQLTVQKLLL